MTSAAHPLANAQLGPGSLTGSLVGQHSILTNNTASSVTPRPPWHTQNLVRISVEKVDNGYIMRSSKHEGEVAKVKICTTMDELKDLFVATLVEHQLEK